jgi:WD40 repeat protein
MAASGNGAGIAIHRFESPETTHRTLAGAARGTDTAVCFSRDSTLLFVGNEDGQVRVWDTATWQEQPALGWPAHRSAVTALAVSHDGTLIATSGDDTLKLYAAHPPAAEPRRRERLSFTLDQPANWIRFAGKDGRDHALLHCSRDGALVKWETGR